MRDANATRLPTWLLPPIFLGFALALFGTYWDDAWHTEIGRDSFLAAPHIALYLGIALVGGALTLWALLTFRQGGWRGLLDPPLLLSLVGVATALGAAPLDNAWHLAFGRDAVLWSPPHMLGVAGNLAIAGGLFLELRGRSALSERIAAQLAASSLLAVAVVPVLEYDTDVPQFDAVYYLPVLAFSSAFAMALIRDSLRERFAVVAISLIYAAIMGIIALVLLLGEMPHPTVPLLILSALVMDLGRDRLNSFSLALAFAFALYLTYIPYLNWVKDGVFLDGTDVLIGFVLATAGVWAALLLVTGSGPRFSRLAPGAATAVMVFVLALPPNVLGHDPGQGGEIATADLTGRSQGSSATLEVDLRDTANCGRFAPDSLVARRAGVALDAPLQHAAPCQFEGSIALPERGRWFVYAEMTADGERVETWLPLHSDEFEVRSEDDRSVYIPPAVESPLVKTIAGIAMYVGLLAVVLAIPAFFRRATPARLGERPL
jgi:hypothetical protein